MIKVSKITPAIGWMITNNKLRSANTAGRSFWYGTDTKCGTERFLNAAFLYLLLLLFYRACTASHYWAYFFDRLFTVVFKPFGDYRHHSAYIESHHIISAFFGYSEAFKYGVEYVPEHKRIRLIHFQRYRVVKYGAEQSFMLLGKVKIRQ